ncbi:unnamed protein product [Closterium sp. Naga37s-1]|nr:unnamed protein product [Closterium sp. Naga37s-1]
MDTSPAPPAIPAALASRDEVLASVTPAVGRRAADVWDGGKLSDVSFGGKGWNLGEAKCLGSNPGEAYTVGFDILTGTAAGAAAGAGAVAASSRARAGGRGRGRATGGGEGVPCVKVEGKCTCPAHARPLLHPLPLLSHASLSLPFPTPPTIYATAGRSANGVCKHVVALLLERASQLSSMPPVSSARVPNSTVATSLHAADTSAPAADTSAPGRDASACAPRLLSLSPSPCPFLLASLPPPFHPFRSHLPFTSAPMPPLISLSSCSPCAFHHSTPSPSRP